MHVWLCAVLIFVSTIKQLTQFEIYTQVNLTRARALISSQIIYLTELCVNYYYHGKNRNGNFEFVLIYHSIWIFLCFIHLNYTPDYEYANKRIPYRQLVHALCFAFVPFQIIMYVEICLVDLLFNVLSYLLRPMLVI